MRQPPIRCPPGGLHHSLRRAIMRAAWCYTSASPPNWEEKPMTVQLKKSDITADAIGLTTVPDVSRRGFMTASAAVAAGYTLAAGPVRADAIKTDTTGLT